TVKLTVDGQTQVQPLTVKMDPRVQTPPEGLKKQLELSLECHDGLRRVEEALEQAAELRARLKQRAAGAAIAALGEKAVVPLTEVGAELAALLGRLQQTDAAPGPQTVTAVREALEAVGRAVDQW